jgi:protein-ribulosamine 3-kinase
LHLVTNQQFGFDADNFIGRLPQSNAFHSDWAGFYWDERILPQLQLAKQNGMIEAEFIPTK